MHGLEDIVDDEMPTSLRDMLVSNSFQDFTEDMKFKNMQLSLNLQSVNEFSKESRDLFEEKSGTDHFLGDYTKEMSQGSSGSPPKKKPETSTS